MKHLWLLVLVFIFSCKEQGQKNEVATLSDQQISNDPLEIYDFNGLEKFLNTTDDKVHVVNFWATWCKPCVKELPYFEQINESYKGDVEVLLVSLDFPSKYETKLKPYIKENKLQSKVVALDDVNSNVWIPKVDETWTGAIPATIIFTKDKRKFYEQSFDYNELENEIKQFLK